MKKFLRFVIILLLIVAAAVVVLGLVEPKEVIVARTAMIKAPKEAVFEQIQYFKNWPNWDPWYKMDSAKMKISYGGTDGSAGSSFHWSGGDKTGEGDMKNLGVTGTLMNYEVSFTKPDKYSSQGIIKAEDSAGITKVTWNIVVKMPFPMNAMLVFMNMDKMLGGDFENGLNNMKQYVESHAAAMPTSDVEIKEVDYPAHLFEGIRKTVSVAELGKFFGESMHTLGDGMKSKINGPATGVFYTWDTTTNTTDMVAAFPAYDTTVLVKGASFIHMPASRAYMAVLKGGYGAEMKYHNALHQYMMSKGKTQSLVIEEYVVTDHQEPDSNKWVTNIYYLIKQ